MRDPITDAAQDPSCLLCLTPDRGGSWWSRLRPAMPRDFSEGYRWDALQAAMYSSLPWTSDYHFTFDFTVTDDFENGSYWVMNQSNGRISFALEKDARGSRFVFGSYSFNGGVFVYAPFASSLAGRHEVTLAVEGATLRVTVDGTVYEQSGERVESSAYNRVVTTSAPVTLHAVSLTDDSTGTAVWQAAYSDLYDTSNPWPSPVPENFAENAKAFYDCQAVVQEALDPTHDYSFLIEADRVSERTENSLFYAGTDKLPFGVYYHADHTIKFFTNLLRNEGDPSGTYASLNFYIGTDWLLGRHAFEARIEGNAITTYVDGVQYATSNKFARTGTAAVGLPNCNSGYVYKIQITDLTDNQVVWSYPSEAERVRLITKTNVRTDRGYFEQADTTVNSYVNTALDLRGRVSSYTVFIDFYPAVFPESNNAECHQELAGQGGALIGSGFPPICSVGYYKTVDQTYRLQFAQQSGSLRRTVNVTLAAALSGRCRIVGVVDVQSSSTTLTLYLDGEQIGTSTYSGIPDGTAASIARCFSVAGVKEYGGWINYTGKVYSCLLFDRALSAAEIAALTPKQA